MNSLLWPPLWAMLAAREASMPISPEAQYAIDTADRNVRDVQRIPLASDQANSLAQTQILLLRAILVEVATLTAHLKARDSATP